VCECGTCKCSPFTVCNHRDGPDRGTQEGGAIWAKVTMRGGHNDACETIPALNLAHTVYVLVNNTQARGKIRVSLSYSLGWCTQASKYQGRESGARKGPKGHVQAYLLKQREIMMQSVRRLHPRVPKRQQTNHLVFTWVHVRGKRVRSKSYDARRPQRRM
jgi:hypothetical protein